MAKMAKMMKSYGKAGDRSSSVRRKIVRREDGTIRRFRQLSQHWKSFSRMLRVAVGNTRVTHKTRVYNCHHDASPPYLLSFWRFLSHDHPKLSRQSDIEENERCDVILLMVNALYQCVSSLCEVASSRKTKMPNCSRKSTFLQKLFTWQKAKVFPLCEIVNRRIFE